MPHDVFAAESEEEEPEAAEDYRHEEERPEMSEKDLISEGISHLLRSGIVWRSTWQARFKPVS